MATRSPLINVMVRAAEKAAKGLLRDFGEVENLQVSRKGPADFVSTADTNAQKIIHEELSKARPEFGFLMEEKGLDKEGDWRWIVDPLDGTTNFLHGVPFWNITIAAEHKNQVMAGIVFDPFRNELFWAERGMGAYSNRARLRVSGRKDLSDCLVVTGFPFKGSRKDPGFFTQLEHITAQVAGVRRTGSAALDIAYVAAGRFDAYWESGINAWDCAAGSLLVTEAGGTISPMVEGEVAHHGAMIATNGHIHNEFVDLVRRTKA